MGRSQLSRCRVPQGCGRVRGNPPQSGPNGDAAVQIKVRFNGDFMRKFFVTLLGASLLSAPAYAREWRDQSVGIKPGVFVGAKLRLSLGKSAAARPRAGFAIAPTRSRISGEGMLSTNIGEGTGLNLGFGAKPTLRSLASGRAKRLASRPDQWQPTNQNSACPMWPRLPSELQQHCWRELVYSTSRNRTNATNAMTERGEPGSALRGTSRSDRLSAGAILAFPKGGS